MNDRKIRITAIAAIAFSALHIIASLAVFAAPEYAVQLFAYDVGSTDISVPLEYYVYITAYAFNILAMALILNRRGVYAPLVICAVSAVLGSVVSGVAGGIETIIYSRTLEIKPLVIYSALSSANDFLLLITFTGFAISIPLSSAYACLRKKENYSEYRPPVKGWTVTALVILILCVLSEIIIILSQKQIVGNFLNYLVTTVEGLRIPASSVIVLLTAAAAVVCCVFLLKGKRVDSRAVFCIAVLYPIISRVVSIVEFRTLSAEMLAYYSTLSQFSASGLCRLGVMICAAAAAAKAAETSITENIRQEHGFNIS